jgi:hypothetical protein
MASLGFNRSSFAFAAVALASALTGMLAPSAAKADLIFDLTSDHCTGGCLQGAPNAGTITVSDLGGGTLGFTVEMADGFGIINTGLEASIGFNLVGIPTITYSAITPSASFEVVNGTGSGNLTQATQNLHMDGTGFFTNGLDCIVHTPPGSTPCGPGSSVPFFGTVTFDITASGLTLASLGQNADGQFFAVDVTHTVNGVTFTGAVDASVERGGVPEPGSLMILGTTLAGGSLFLRRRRRGANSS